ncbi:MAG: TolC family protein [Bacillota bacterium]|nr:TolC family protein [Bacillota bacterium]
MKKRILPLLLVALVVLSSVVMAVGTERNIVPDMNFTGDAIHLSLDEAIEIMQTKGSRAEAAALNKASDEAIAKGHKESAETISEYLRNLEQAIAYDKVTISEIAAAEAGGATKTNEKIMKLRRDFAKEQVEANYQAELNEIEAMTIQVYYGVLQAEENLRVAKENLTNQKTIYDNTIKKYQQGTVAKVDTLTAEIQVLQAEQQVALAETALKNAKMNFNLLLGYDLMQEVVLTDKLVMVDEPEGTLVEFIESALDNRNEIKGAALGAQVQEILFTGLEYRYPKTSSTYLKQEVATLQARKAAADVPVQIEMDIRVRYMDLADKKRAVEVAEAYLANAKEGCRLALISYDVGMNTLTDVHEAQIASYQAALGLAKAITDYDLAVYEFKHAIGVGTTRIPL